MPRAVIPADPPATPERIRDAIVAAENGDPDALRGVLDRAVVWHTPGNNLTGGDHMGAEQSIELVREQRRLSEGTLRVEPRALTSGAVVLHATAAREGHGRLDQDEEIRFKVENGKVSELWTRPRDVGAWDAFFSP